jgi:transposase
MESTGIYWKSPYAALEAVGLRATVVNARHVKQVPGRTALTHDPAESGSFAGNARFCGRGGQIAVG